MATRNAFPALLAALGALALAGATISFTASPTGSGQEFEALARVAMAILLAAASGLLSGAALLSARALRASLPRAVTFVAAAGCAIALLAGFQLLRVSVPANIGLAVFAAVALLVSLGGIATLGPRTTAA